MILKTATEILLPYLDRWDLKPDGESVQTAYSLLLPVRKGDVPLMLKLSGHEEEIHGNAMMVLLQGHGAAKVYEHAGPALLMARADEPSGVQTLSDDLAISEMCRALNRLHRSTNAQAFSTAIPLSDWMVELTQSDHTDVLYQRAAHYAREMLKVGNTECLLHGDMHHGNLLAFASEFRMIDPKGLKGPRGYDFANMFRNPLGVDHRIHMRPRLDLVSELSGVPRSELAAWVMVQSSLSALWSKADGDIGAQKTAEVFALYAEKFIDR